MGGRTRTEQEIVYEKLPGDIAERYVLLMDPILGTGNSAARAIEVRGPCGGLRGGLRLPVGLQSYCPLSYRPLVCWRFRFPPLVCWLLGRGLHLSVAWE